MDTRLTCKPANGLSSTNAGDKIASFVRSGREGAARPGGKVDLNTPERVRRRVQMAYSATTYHAATREAVNLATLIVRVARILATSLFGFAALTTVTTRAPIGTK
jgi:hypothetical protein